MWFIFRKINPSRDVPVAREHIMKIEKDKHGNLDVWFSDGRKDEFDILVNVIDDEGKNMPFVYEALKNIID